jgi:glycosyltransferase involved in cell wall biosynthesis
VGPSAEGHAETLRRMAIDLSIPDVEFEEAAFGDAKWREYSSASLTVLPSRSENFGMTVAESLASSTPVIASQHTPWEGLIREGCGWWPRLDQATLAGTLDEAMRMSDASRLEMGRRGREWVKRSFSWDGIAGQMSNLFTWIVGGGAPPDCVRLE